MCDVTSFMYSYITQQQFNVFVTQVAELQAVSVSSSDNEPSLSAWLIEVTVDSLAPPPVTSLPTAAKDEATKL